MVCNHETKVTIKDRAGDEMYWYCADCPVVQWTSTKIYK